MKRRLCEMMVGVVMFIGCLVGSCLWGGCTVEDEPAEPPVAAGTTEIDDE